jgi:hypothetical protein
MAVTKNNKPRINQGRSNSDLPSTVPVSGAACRRPPVPAGLEQRVSRAAVVLPQRLQTPADGGNSVPHAGQTMISTSLDSMTENGTG